MKQERFNSRYPQLAYAICVLILGGSLGARAYAQEHGKKHRPDQEAGKHEEAEHEESNHEEHGFHRHHLSVFLGATSREVPKLGGHGEVGAESEEGEGNGETETKTEASIALDYEYRLSRAWGIGLLFDYVGQDVRAWVAGIPVTLHAIGGLKLLAAPGLEHHEGENEFLVRLGVMYAFEVGAWSITPAFNVDFVDSDETYVYGLSIGRGF